MIAVLVVGMLWSSGLLVHGVRATLRVRRVTFSLLMPMVLGVALMALNALLWSSTVAPWA